MKTLDSFDKLKTVKFLATEGKKKKKRIKKKTSEQIKRRKSGSARGIASYEQWIIEQQDVENRKLKKSLKKNK